MCIHREHRTGNCRDCEAEAAARPPMPLLWQDDGDQA